MTVAEYYRAARRGVFKRGEKLELIDGEVFQKVSPPLSPHATVTSIVLRALSDLRREGVYIRVQLPIRLDDYNEPEPDLAVVAGRAEDYLKGHPGARDVKLLVEVADSSIQFDKGRKAKLYAEFGISEYWVADVNGRSILVFREPEAEGYRSCQVFGADGAVSPLFAPKAVFKVAELIPSLED